MSKTRRKPVQDSFFNKRSEKQENLMPQQLRSFKKHFLPTDTDKINIIELVNNSTAFSAKLSEQVRNFATISIQQNPNDFSDLTLLLAPVSSKFGPLSQQEFEHVCNKLLNSFLGRFSSSIVHSTVSTWQSFRELCAMKTSHTVWMMEGVAHDCFIKSNSVTTTGACLITVTGESRVVCDILQCFHELHEKNQEPHENIPNCITEDYSVGFGSLPYPLKPFDMWIPSTDSIKINLIECIQNSTIFLERFSFHMKNFACITISNTSDHSHDVLLQLLPVPAKFESISQKDFESVCKKLLQIFFSKYSSQTFECSTSHLENFRKKFGINNYDAVWVLNGISHDCHFNIHSQTSHGTCFGTVTGETAVVEDICKRLEKLEHLKISPKKVFTTECTPMNKAEQKEQTLSNYFKKHEHVIPMEEIQKTFILKVALETNFKEYLKDVTFKETTNGMHLTGKQRILNEVVDEIKNLLESLQTALWYIEEQWKIKFLKSAAGKQFLENLQENEQCVILTKNKRMSTNDSFATFHQPIDELSKTENQKTSCQIEVFKGDILTMEADVMLNIVGSNFDLEANEPSKLLRRKADASTSSTWSKPGHCIFAKPKYRVALAGRNLPYRYVVHLMIESFDGFGTDSVVTNDLLEILKLADKLQQASIVLSAIGTEIANPNLENSAAVIQSAVQMFQTTKPTNLRTVKVVLPSESFLPFFAHLDVNNKRKHNYSNPETSLDEFSNSRTLGKANETNHPEDGLALHVCSTSEDNNNKIFRKMILKLSKIEKEALKFSVASSTHTKFENKEQNLFPAIQDVNQGGFPSHWENSKPQQLVKISSEKQEYRNVIKKFEKAGLHLNCIVQLDRVENKRQYTQFVAQKQDVQQRIGISAVTKQLFHGTSSDICEKIYKNGFDRSYSGRNATRLGEGVYFATTSCYSHSFSEPDEQEHRKMFLADVITGQYVQGHRGMRVPPPISDDTTDLYDSVVDDVDDPTIYVVFKDASAYPLYILTYT